METQTIREVVSQVRGIYKIESEDAFVTDRFLYSLFKKYADVLLRRKQNEGKIMNNDSLFQWLNVVPLIEVDKIEAECVNVKTGCTYMRTKEKLPKMVSFDNGPVIKLVMSLDTSENVERTTVLEFHRMTKSVNFKYNKAKYYWFNKGYFYFPNVMWSTVTVQALFEESVIGYCADSDSDCEECAGSKKRCTYRQDDSVPYPNDLIADVIGMIQRDLATRGQIPSDTQDNSQNLMR